MSKSTGDIGELAFILKAKIHGLITLTPFSSITPYDVMIDNGRTSLKIQVKTTKMIGIQNGKRRADTYKINVGHGKKSTETYCDSPIDFFAIYILPIDKFFIIPKEEIKVKTIHLFPEKNSHRFTKYLEQWDLLK